MIRLATIDDISGILQCLESLSEVFYEPWSYLLYGWEDRERSGIFTFVYQKQASSQIIGTASVVRIRKLSHQSKCVCLIDDVAVHKDYQKQGIGKELVGACLDFVKGDGNNYKIILQCKPELKSYYEQWGFKESGIEMRLDLN